MRSSITCLAAALLVGATAASAQARPLETWGGMDLFTSAVNPIAADSAGVGHRAYGLQLTASAVTYGILSLSAEGGMVIMSDEAAFTENTTRGEMTSGVTALIGTISAGLRTPSLALEGPSPATLSAGVNAGHTFLSVARSISNCSDCHSEDLNIGAGSFWEPMVTLGLPRYSLYARYRTYMGGSDFRDALTIGFMVKRERTPAPAQAPVDPPAPDAP